MTLDMGRDTVETVEDKSCTLETTRQMLVLALAPQKAIFIINATE